MRSDTFYTNISAFAVMLPGYTVGTLLGWECILTLNNDSNWESVPFGYIAAILGVLVTSFIMDKCGRHICLWIFCWFMYIAVLVRCFVQDSANTCFVRILGGLGVGAYYQLIPIYISELVYRKHRGLIMASVGFLIGFGNIMAASSYAQPNLIILDILLGIAYVFMKFFYVPETPYYHVAAGSIMKAKKTLQDCRKYDNWSGEIREITLDVSAYPQDATNCFTFALAIIDFHADFLHRGVTGLGLLLLSECMFVHPLLGLPKYLYGTLEDYGITILQLIIITIAFLINFFIIDKNGRKILLFASAIGVAVFYFILFIIALADEGRLKSTAAIVIFKFIVLSFYVGLDFIPFMYMNEVWPYRIRASAVAFTLCVYFIVKCLCPLFYFYTLIYFHEAVLIFTIFLLAIGTAFFIWFIPPETKRLSLCAIQIKMDHDVTVLERELRVH